jgi:predicted dehydrogenase
MCLLGLLAIALFSAAAVLSCHRDVQRAQAQEKEYRQTIAFYNSLEATLQRSNAVLDSINAVCDSIKVTMR